jgi:protein gp37
MSRERDPGQWWSEAWSPVTGCTPAGAGCDHCWARAMVRRFPALHQLTDDEGETTFPAPFDHVMVMGGVSWVVVGGENGPGARPMGPRWAIDLREQCKAAGVAFWFKGYGSVMRGSCFAEGSGLVPLEQTREVPW